MKLPPRSSNRAGEGTTRAALALGALGVVFGDIGTSPLYAVQAVYSPAGTHPVPVTRAGVFGVISLIFWAIVIIVTVTYVLLVMRADNDGEGGIMALITLLRRSRARRRRRTTALLAGLGIFGASLFFGDSMITPAISVLSATGGLNVVDSSLEHMVVPATAAILVALFVFQRRGTASIGRLFGPIMLVWFLAIAAGGVHGISRHPQILEALSPTYAVSFLVGHFTVAFFALGAVVLAVTGAEALYADLGHFGRTSITRAWLGVVFPACALSYLGQGALLLGDPDAATGNPFFLVVPTWGRLPMVLLATAATVIASQAVITGAYSVAHQAMRLGYLPRLHIEHTSDQRIGQIYVPWINWTLLCAVLVLVFAFRDTTALASAYGVAVTGTITITTLLFFRLVRERWSRSPWWLALPAGTLLTVDLLFLAANLTKIAHGAWLPLMTGVAIFTVLTTWQRGRAVVTRERELAEGSLAEFVEELEQQRPARVPGTGVFLNRGADTAPLALRAHLDRLHVLPQRVVILTVSTLPVPHVPATDRLRVRALGRDGDDLVRVTARFGYKDPPDVPEALRLLERFGAAHAIDTDSVTYFLSKIELGCGTATTMARWRKRLFLATAAITADAAEHFRLPRTSTVIIGSRIEV